MGETTAIEWADHTWNFWRGCSDVHTGCKNCYAKRDQSIRAHGIEWGPRGTRALAAQRTREAPLRWNRAAARNGSRYRPRVFPSLMDPFEDDLLGMRMVTHDGNQVWMNEIGGFEYWPPDTLPAPPSCQMTLDDARLMMYGTIDQCPLLDFLMLTKRPWNIQKMTPRRLECMEKPGNVIADKTRENVWLISSASDQETLVQMVPSLFEVAALTPVIGLSLEPLIGPIELGSFLHSGLPCPLDWVIVGGESGPKARFCDQDWIIDIVDQCSEYGVACYVKQAGDNTNMICSAPKGGDPEEWPVTMRVREYPQRREVRKARP